jgi:hypothetical protein
MSRKLVALGACSLAIALTLLIAYARRPSTLSFTNDERLEADQLVQSRIEVELLVLRSDGFQPSEIKRPPGKFLLALQNHSSEAEPSFTLTREAGQSLKQIRFSKNQSKYREFIDLLPGRYVLAETNHPDWTCRIIIEQ